MKVVVFLAGDHKDKVLTCTIDRNLWHRGDGDEGAALMNKFNNFCCLGFLGAKVGVPEEAMENTLMPHDLPFEFRTKYPNIADREWDAFALINDDEEITDSEREQQLRALAKKHGFRFRFVD
jgi:hypothetical protein